MSSQSSKPNSIENEESPAAGLTSTFGAEPKSISKSENAAHFSAFGASAAGVESSENSLPSPAAKKFSFGAPQTKQNVSKSSEPIAPGFMIKKHAAPGVGPRKKITLSSGPGASSTPLFCSGATPKVSASATTISQVDDSLPNAEPAIGSINQSHPFSSSRAPPAAVGSNNFSFGGAPKVRASEPAAIPPEEAPFKFAVQPASSTSNAPTKGAVDSTATPTFTFGGATKVRASEPAAIPPGEAPFKFAAQPTHTATPTFSFGGATKVSSAAPTPQANSSGGRPKVSAAVPSSFAFGGAEKAPAFISAHNTAFGELFPRATQAAADRASAAFGTVPAGNSSSNAFGQAAGSFGGPSAVPFGGGGPAKGGFRGGFGPLPTGTLGGPGAVPFGRGGPAKGGFRGGFGAPATGTFGGAFGGSPVGSFGGGFGAPVVHETWQSEPRSIAWTPSNEDESLPTLGVETSSSSRTDENHNAEPTLEPSLLHSTVFKVVPTTQLTRTILVAPASEGSSASQSATPKAPWIRDSSYKAGFGQLCFNSLGELYFTIPLNHTLAMMHPNGTFSPVLGPPSQGLSAGRNGSFSEATLITPSGANFDRNNRLFISESDTHGIRLLDFSSRTVSTMTPETGAVAGLQDGVLSKAQFRWPRQLKFTRRGDLLVCDCGNNAIRIILADPVLGLIHGQCRVRTLASHQSGLLLSPRSMHIMPSGRLLVLGRDAPTVVNQDGTVQAWGYSSEGISDICVDAAGKHVALLTSDWRFGMVKMDPPTESLGVVNPNNGVIVHTGSSPASHVFSLSQPELSFLISLPDGSGFICYLETYTGPQMTLLKEGGKEAPYLAPYHQSQPFNLSPLLHDYKHQVTATMVTHPTHNTTYPLHKLILQFRCPGLLEPDVLDSFLAISRAPQAAFDDIFLFIYEDRIAPLPPSDLVAVHHLIALHLLASTCELQKFALFLKYRIFSYISTNSSTIKPMQVIDYALQIGVPPDNSLLDDFFAFLSCQPPQMVQSQINQLIDGVEDKAMLKKITGSVLTQNRFVSPPLVDPFRQLGPSLATLAPSALAKKREHEATCDFVIVVAGEPIPVHSLILGARWPYFARMIQSNLQEATQGRWEDAQDLGFTPSGMLGFIRYLYSGSLDGLTDDDECYPVVEHAEFFGFEGNPDHEELLRHCKKRSQFAVAERSEKPDYLKILESAILHNNQKLVNRTIQAIAKDFDRIFETPTKLTQFETLPVKFRVSIMRTVKSLRALPK